ncbi:MAG: hypothetical protein J6M07_10920, partial [Ruminococcus sp.]|nr:hypothetical protein [Ruminococcus sp.]
GGTLNLNGHTLTVTGDLNISDSGTLYMVNENDRIVVDGNMLVNGYYRSTLTDGTIEVNGNFTQKYIYYTDNFRANGNHRVILNGNGLQKISFDRMESGFNILDIQNFSDEGIDFITPVTINTLEDNGCNVKFANGERPGWVLSGDETIEGDLFLARGTLDLNGHKLTVTGDLVQSGGEIIVNSGELVVQGDYRIQSLKNGSYTNSTGTLNMTNDADTVKVIGNFVMQSTASHDGRFSAGVLSVGGDLIQENGGSNANLHTTGTFEIVLDGTDEQHISIYNNSKNYSRIAGLKVENTSDAGVSFDRGVYVVGNLYDTDSVITHGENLYVSSSTSFADNKFSGSVRIADNYKLQEDITIDGDVYLTGGSLDLNGHTLTVTGDLNISDSGTLYMVNENDRIVVDGNMLANGYYRSTLTDGTIEVKGNFTQKYTYYTDNFRANGNHRVIFNGNRLQTVSFDRMESGFNILEINNHSDEGVVFSTPVTINELEDNGCNVTFANGERSGWVLSGDETIEGNLLFARGVLDLNGHKLTVTDDLTQSGGTVSVNGGELEIQGNYRIQSPTGNNTYKNSTGILEMMNDADTVKVNGDFVMQSTQSHDGKLSAGNLIVGGALSQLGDSSEYSFHTTGTHTVILNGAETQSVSMTNSDKSRSRINNLKIENTSDEGVSFDSRVYVVGELRDTGSVTTNGSNLYISAETVFPDGQYNGDVRFAENYTLSDDLMIGGNVYITGGTLNLNGHTLTVTGDLNISDSGTLYMVNENDRIVVDGNMLVNGYYR